jgi:hypothetical protein
VNTRIALATTKKYQLSISDCYTKMCHYIDDLATSSAPLYDDELVTYLLAGLDEDFNPVFTTMVAQVDPISPGELYAQLLSFEQHTNLQASSISGSSSSALAHLVVVAILPLLAIMAMDMVVAAAPLMVASTTNLGNHPDSTVALRHAHSTNCA